MDRLCLFDHFLKCRPWASLDGGHSYFLKFLVEDMYFGECLPPFFFLTDQVSDRVTCIYFLSTIGVSIGCLPRFLSMFYLLIIFYFLLK